MTTVIAQGRVASAAIDRFLGGSGDLERFARKKPVIEPRMPAPRGSARSEWRSVSAKARVGGFALVEQAYGRQPPRRSRRWRSSAAPTKPCTRPSAAAGTAASIEPVAFAMLVETEVGKTDWETGS